MRSKLISILILISFLVFSTLPATANHISDVSISADCYSFTIIVTGSVFKPVTVDYSLTLTPSSGDEIIIKGSSEVPYPPKAFNTAIGGSWGIDLSGVYTVTGTISLVSYDLNPIRIWESRDFNPIILECEKITCGECKGKVTQLTLQYNGESPALVEVEQKKPKVKVFSASVQPGETFTFDGADNKGTLGTEILIYVDGILNTKIHTSCSQPIGPGLIRGDFEVIEGFSRIGGALCPIIE